LKFKDSLIKNDFVVTAQINMEDAPTAESVLRHGEILRPVVDGVQLTDESSSKIQMAGLAAAALLKPRGIDPILHMTCRDRNRIAMDKDLIGAAAIGVSSILVRRGKKLQRNEKSDTRNVFDISAVDFMAYVQSLKNVEDNLLAPGFLTGADATVVEPTSDWVPQNLNRKHEAGTNFVQGQICFNMDIVRNYMAHMVASKLTHKIRFIMTLSPLPSAENARWIRENVDNAIIPRPIVKRLQQASDPEQEGINICAELLQELASIPGVSGANLMTMGKLETIPAAIEASGVRSSRL
jgi:methylenetetrahydrofolate reductase (NADPH)